MTPLPTEARASFLLSNLARRFCLVFLALSSSAWAQNPQADAGKAEGVLGQRGTGSSAAEAPAKSDNVISVEEAVVKLNALWKTRDDAASMKESEALVSQVLEKDANAYEVLWRAARIRWWVADGANDERLKKTYAKQGWTFAERALKVKGDGLEAQYYVALCIGAYSQSVGILKALSEGLESKFVSNLDAAMARNDDFDRSGTHTAKGRYWWELPWPKRDLAKSKAELEKAIAKHPEHLRSYYYLADTLLKDGDKAGAKAANDKALNGSAEYDAPEARRVKAWAKKLAQEL